MGLIFAFTPISFSLVPNSQPPMYVHAHEPVLHVSLQSVQSFLTVPVARLHTGDDDDGEGLHGHLYVVVLPQVQDTGAKNASWPLFKNSNQTKIGSRIFFLSVSDMSHRQNQFMF